MSFHWHDDWCDWCSCDEDTCHNGHPFAPGIDIDMIAEGRDPDPRWCNVCGEARQTT